MVTALTTLVDMISLSDRPIPEIEFQKYAGRIDLTASADCCYGADCGDCDCGGYCIDS